MNKGVFRGRRLVSESSINQMLEMKVKVPDELYGGGDLYYGYGLVVQPGFLGYTLVSHSGSVYVSTAYMGLLPELKKGVVVLANSSGYSLSSIGE